MKTLKVNKKEFKEIPEEKIENSKQRIKKIMKEKYLKFPNLR